MPSYLISSREAGRTFGVYSAPTEDDAREAYARDAGYRDCADEAAVLETTVERLHADLVVEPVDVADAIATIAAAMVEIDRASCDPVTRDDADATSADGWDFRGTIDAGEDAGLDRRLARAIAAQYTPQIRAAYARAWRAAVEVEIAAVEAAIMLVSDVTSDSYQDDDGSYVFAIADDGGDDAERDLACVRAALPPGWRVDWTGDGNTDGHGYSTSDARVWRDDDAEDAADGVPLRIVAGRRVDLDGVPHLLVGTLGCDPEHGDGTREADLLVEAGILGKRVALREENCWAYPVLHDDRGLAVAACPKVAPYLAGRAEAERKARERAAAARGAS